MCAEETVWDRELNLGVGVCGRALGNERMYNGEWRDLKCNQKWILLAFSRSSRIEK